MKLLSALSRFNLRSLKGPHAPQFPLPYKGMLALSSDVEFTSWQAQLDLIELFAQHGLECGFSYWCFGDPKHTWSFLDKNNLPTKHASAAASLARAGILDTLHSYGGVTDGEGCIIDRLRMRHALDYLVDQGIKTRVYTNHGTTKDIQNIGGNWANYQQGDVQHSTSYHLDMASEFGIRFFWTDIDYDNDNAFFGIDKDSSRPLLISQRGRDGTPFLRFKRFRGNFSTAPYSETIGDQLNLVLSQPPVGYSILYQHLGVQRAPDGGFIQARSPYFKNDGFSMLKKLAELQRGGELLVTTTERLLVYALLMSAKPWVIINRGSYKQVIFSKSIIFEGVAVELNKNDLQGWSIEVDSGTKVIGQFDGMEWELKNSQVNGKVYATIPWTFIPIFDELERAKNFV